MLRPEWKIPKCYKDLTCLKDHGHSGECYPYTPSSASAVENGFSMREALGKVAAAFAGLFRNM